MRLELTRRWVEHKSHIDDIELYDGLKVEYYDTNFKWLENPSWGYIRENNGGFRIVWDDNISDTILDGSERSNEILKYCGFSE